MKRRKGLTFRLSIILLILGIAIGYAYLNSTLVINGDTSLKSNSWSVKFTTITPVKNDGTITTTPIITNDTTLTFGVKLNVPGDEYILKVKVENQGTIDAMLNSTPTISGLSDLSSCLESSITYSDGVPIEVKNLLPAHSEDEVMIKLKFKDNISESDLAILSENDVSRTLTFTMNYVKADNTAEEVAHIKPKCKKATTLHTETCDRTNNGCYAVGYYSGGSKGTTTITYGHTDSSKLTNGELTNGQSQGYALTCDVDGNGTYDEVNERFYYVSDFYDTNTKSFDSSYAALIQSKNYGSSAVAYDSSSHNYYGPRTLLSSLPTSGTNGTWKNMELKNTTRQILSESGTATSESYNLPSFSYAGKAARLLTTQEVNTACNITVGTGITGELDTCEFLMEDSYYSKTSGCSGGSCNYWLETPASNVNYYIWYAYGYSRNVNNIDADSSRGVRLAIDVAKSDISLE